MRILDNRLCILDVLVYIILVSRVRNNSYVYGTEVPTALLNLWGLFLSNPSITQLLYYF